MFLSPIRSRFRPALYRKFLTGVLFVSFIQAAPAQDSASSSHADTTYGAVGFTRHNKYNLAPFILPTVLTASGIYYTYHTGLIDRYAVRDWRNEHYPDFQTTADNYLQFAPAAAMYALDLAGIKGRNDVRTQTIKLAEAEVLMTILVRSLKATMNIPRPDSDSDNSFPSGHTAQAFLAATFLHKEFGKGRWWLSTAGYVVAASVGAMRVLNNRHWVTDALGGAGIGMISAELVYLPLFEGKKAKKKQGVN